MSLAFNGTRIYESHHDEGDVQLEWVGGARDLRRECPGLVAPETSQGRGGEHGSFSAFTSAVPIQAKKSSKAELGAPGPGASTSSRPFHMNEYDAHHGTGEESYLQSLGSAWFSLCPHGEFYCVLSKFETNS